MLPPILEAVGVSKQFPGVRALDDVSLAVHAGEVVAVVGENGAGKSTLMKILAGVYQPDAGGVRQNGEPVRFDNPADAMRAGVSLIHQELNLAENLTVADNLFLGREPTHAGPLRLVDRGAVRRRGAALLDRVGLPAGVLHRPVGSLPPGQKQLVEIARALGLDARVLIMDEPTSSLTQQETDQLYEVIAGLKAAGVSVVYISHRLAEVTRIADRAVVLRDGKLAGELAKAELTHDNLVRLMVGRELSQFFPHGRRTPGEPVLTVRGLKYAGGPDAAATFTIRAGEVVGMAGLVGAGRTELAEAVFGVRTVTAGEILVDGTPVRIRRPRDAIQAGILLVPEDRRRHGLVTDDSVGSNLSLPNLIGSRVRSPSPLGGEGLGVRGEADRGQGDAILGGGNHPSPPAPLPQGERGGRNWQSLTWSLLNLIVPRREAALHREMIDRLRIKTPSAGQTVGLLSGGNQQKIVFAKWLARGPRVLILDEPTRGVDVGAKAEIYQLVDELAARGVAVWMISSDMEELLGTADRVVVVHEGRLAGELGREQLSEVAVMRLATGGDLG